MVTLTNRFNINTQRIFRDIGYSPGCKPSARMVSLVNEYVENAHDLIEPSYSYILRDVELVLGSYIIIEGSIVFESEVIARLMEKCQKAALFVLTIDTHLEETAHWLRVMHERRQ